jgi:hypothetical protein
MLSFKERLAKNAINMIGWRCSDKFLVIESDDWGTVRMPSKQSYDFFKSRNISIDQLSFDRYDSLESSEDLLCLFDTLGKVRDSEGNSAVLTAFHVMANPNFEEIYKCGKSKYIYESILDSYSRNVHTSNNFKVIQDGIKSGFYVPQFHGREHIHVKRWMEAINSNSLKEQLAFDQKAIIWTGFESDINSYNKDYFKGFDFENHQESKDVELIHRDGLRLFKEIFNMDSLTFTAQGSIWGDQILPMLYEEGVRLIGGQQFMPNGLGGYKKINKFWGAKNELGQIHWRRNVLFEPSRDQNFNSVGKCLEEIEIAFRWGKPAVISTHRQNFIGSIFEDNRAQSLEKLHTLLKSVVKKWPDVKFISSAQLATIMLQSK